MDANLQRTDISRHVQKHLNEQGFQRIGFLGGRPDVPLSVIGTEALRTASLPRPNLSHPSTVVVDLLREYGAFERAYRADVFIRDQPSSDTFLVDDIRLKELGLHYKTGYWNAPRASLPTPNVEYITQQVKEFLGRLQNDPIARDNLVLLIRTTNEGGHDISGYVPSAQTRPLHN